MRLHLVAPFLAALACKHTGEAAKPTGVDAYGTCLRSHVERNTAVSAAALTTCTKNMSTQRQGKPVGGLTAAEIAATIRIDLYQVQRCYDQALKSDKTLKGKILTTFIIDEAGHVDSVKTTKDTIGNAALTACTTERIKTWLFPAPRGGQKVTVNYPFGFAPI